MALPVFYTYLLEAWETHQTDLSSLVILMTGGTKVPSDLIRRYLDIGIPLAHGYGSTEAWESAHGRLRWEWIKRHLRGNLWKALKSKSKILRREKNSLKEKSAKSLFTRHSYLKAMRTTLKRQQKCSQNGWFKTGDSGYVDEDGFIFITGRYKDVIIYGGDNVYPDQVEEVIQQIPESLKQR